MSLSLDQQVKQISLIGNQLNSFLAKAQLNSEEMQSMQRAALMLLLTVDQHFRAMRNQVWQLDEFFTPHVCWIQPKQPKGWRERITSTAREPFELHLCCEQPGEIHQLLEAPYLVSLDKKWFRLMGTVLSVILKVARVALFAAGVVVPGAAAAAAVVDAVIGLCDESTQTPAVVLPARSTQASGAGAGAAASSSSPPPNVVMGSALREFSVWLLSIDPQRHFKGLERVSLLTGEVVWLCPKHAEIARNSAVKVTAALPVQISSGMSNTDLIHTSMAAAGVKPMPPPAQAASSSAPSPVTSASPAAVLASSFPASLAPSLPSPPADSDSDCDLPNFVDE